MTVTTRNVTAGFGWVALFSYSNRIFSLLTTLILAKVLVPEDFGLVAIASMLIEALQIFKDMGLSEAVIYNKREDTKAVDTAHTVLVGYSTLLFLIAAAVAPFAARFYENPAVLPIVLVMSFNLVLDSLRAVPRTLCRKNLEYRKLLIPEVVPVAVSSVASIVMALTGFGVWSLVAKSVLHSFLGMVLLQFVIPYRPKFSFDRAAARELFQYGRFIVGTTILLVALYNIDRFYVSTIAGIAALGMFELAMRIAELPVRQFSFLVGNVMFPVFSKMGRSGQALGEASLKTLKYTAAVTLPAAVAISVYGPPLVSAVYGSRWDGMMIPLRVLAFYAGIRSMSSIIYDLFKATGNPQLMQRASAFKLITVGALGVPVVEAYGLVGMSVLLVLAYLAAFSWEIQKLARIIEVPLVSVLGSLLLPAGLAVTTIPGAYLVAATLTGEMSMWPMMASMTVSAAAYVGGMYWLDKEAVQDLRRFRSSMGAPAVELRPSA